MNTDCITIDIDKPYIANNEFFYHINLHTVKISFECTSIGENAFMGCQNLSVITLPNSITEIKD